MNKLVSFDYYYFLNCFFIYSFLGWIMECTVLSIQERTWVKNTGFIRGPFCTIYGAGALSAYYILKPVSGNVLLLFICGLILASLIEYVTALIMIKLFGSFWWDYNNKPFNYKGVLCLESSIGWGVLTVLLFKVIHPIVESIVFMYPISFGRIAVTIVTLYYVIDFVTSFHKSYRNNEENEDEENDDESNDELKISDII